MKMWRFLKRKYIICITFLTICTVLMVSWSRSHNDNTKIPKNQQFYSGTLKDASHFYSLKKDILLPEIYNGIQKNQGNVARIPDKTPEQHSTSNKDPHLKSPVPKSTRIHKKSGSRENQNYSTLNCLAVIAGNKTELDNFKHRNTTAQKRVTDLAFAEQVQNCSFFKSTGRYPKVPLSRLEALFPIAYIITIHKKSVQVERLLRAIYSPQNIYCIHVDRKANRGFKQAIINIAQCFNNVFIATKLEDVQYATFSRLKADINCLYDLVKKKHPWKYAINLVGQDFPIKTNYEIVTYLKNLNGKNDIPGMVPEGQNMINRFRYKHKHEVKHGQIQYLHENETKSPPPNNTRIYFGTAFFIASRAFVKHILTDKVATDLLQWLNDTYSPDENYWITLNSIPGVPGGRVTPTWASVVKYIHWKNNPSQANYPPCQGQWLRTICVFALGDLPWIVKQVHLFANKFDYFFDSQAIDCLDKWRIERTKNNKV